MSTITLPPDVQPELFSGHEIRIQIFEGPFDLLLHLVRRSEVDVFEVPVSEITRQYLEYLHTMEELNIEVTGDFLVTAATLLLIKSRQLLPVQEALPEEEELEEATSQDELLARLEQYRTFKEAAAILAESRRLRDQMRVRHFEEGEEVRCVPVRLEDVSVFDILAVFQKLLARAAEGPPVHEVPRERVTVGHQIRHILDRLRRGPAEGLTFHEILTGPISRLIVIVTFLAVLELIRRRRLRVFQEHARGEILVQLREDR